MIKALRTLQKRATVMLFHRALDKKRTSKIDFFKEYFLVLRLPRNFSTYQESFR